MPVDSDAALRDARGEPSRLGGGVDRWRRAQQRGQRTLASRAPGEMGFQASALGTIQCVFVVGRNRVGRGAFGAVVGVRLVVAAGARGVKRELDRGRETVFEIIERQA